MQPLGVELALEDPWSFSPAARINGSADGAEAAGIFDDLGTALGLLPSGDDAKKTWTAAEQAAAGSCQTDGEGWFNCVKNRNAQPPGKWRARGQGSRAVQGRGGRCSQGQGTPKMR